MAKKQKIEIELNANDKASKKMDKLEKRTKKLSKSMKALGAAAAIGAVAIVGITAKLVKMAAEEEAVTAITKVLVENQGRSWDELGAATDRYLKKLEKLTTFNDTDLQIAFNELIGVGLDYESALETMTAVTDLAAAKQIDLRTAAQLVGKAFVGQTGSLSRYGIVLEEGLEESEKFDAVLNLIANTMGGAAQAQAGTLEGQMRNLKNQLSNVAEAIGAELIPAITPLIAQFADSLPAALENAKGFIDDNAEALEALGDIGEATFDIMATSIEIFAKLFIKDFDDMGKSTVSLTDSLQLLADTLGFVATKVNELSTFISENRETFQTLAGIGFRGTLPGQILGAREQALGVAGGAARLGGEVIGELGGRLEGRANQEINVTAITTVTNPGPGDVSREVEQGIVDALASETAG